MAKEICIVIGASHAGVNFAFSLRKKGWKGEITLYDSESCFHIKNHHYPSPI